MGHGELDVRNPPMWIVLRACPSMNWRTCWDCGLIALYSNSILPACLCHDCGSADTRVRRDDNTRMKLAADLEKAEWFGKATTEQHQH